MNAPLDAARKPPADHECAESDFEDLVEDRGVVTQRCRVCGALRDKPGSGTQDTED